MVARLTTCIPVFVLLAGYGAAQLNVMPACHKDRRMVNAVTVPIHGVTVTASGASEDDLGWGGVLPHPGQAIAPSQISAA
jgi:hypothetical protein